MYHDGSRGSLHAADSIAASEQTMLVKVSSLLREGNCCTIPRAIYDCRGTTLLKPANASCVRVDEISEVWRQRAESPSSRRQGEELGDWLLEERRI